AGTTSDDLVVAILQSAQDLVSDWSGDLIQVDNGLHGGGAPNTASLLYGTGFTGGDTITVTAGHLSPNDYVGWAIAVVSNATALEAGIPFEGAPTSSQVTISGVEGEGTALLMMSQSDRKSVV